VSKHWDIQQICRFNVILIQYPRPVSLLNYVDESSSEHPEFCQLFPAKSESFLPLLYSSGLQ